MRDAYLSALYELAAVNKEVLALISDNGAIVYDKFRRDFPEQYYNYGISEANMVASAAGLAYSGKIPFVYTITNFLTMRAYEFIRNDVCLQNQNVKLVGTGGGFAYSSLGPTHHGTEDIGLMRGLPNMTILSPASPMEAKKATVAAATVAGPFYLRLGTSKEPEIYEEDYKFEIGKGVQIISGLDVTLIGTGAILFDLIKVARILSNEGISCRVVNIHTIKPIDKQIIITAADQTGLIITVEEHNIHNGLGSAVAEVLVDNRRRPVFKRMGLNDNFCIGYGTKDDLKRVNGLSVEHIIENVKKGIKEK
jgi:transketolase